MFEIRRYTAQSANEWNNFVAASKNGTFLFDRRYMDYHSDRFQDYSLMFYADNSLLAILPANKTGTTLCSHQGLTYGGLVMSSALTVVQTVSLFQELNEYLRANGFKHVCYKCIPWIYQRIPSEEDLYVLHHICHARLAARDYSTTIDLAANLRWERIRRRGIKRAQDAGLTIERTDDFAPFWNVLTDNLVTKYGVTPVHTLSEIELLQSRFPHNIILYNALKEGIVIAGIVLYLTPKVVHAQYSSATPEGKQLGAIDFLYNQIICNDYKDYPYFDFGRSTENADGSQLNEKLVFQKEGYGGRGVCYDIYEYDL